MKKIYFIVPVVVVIIFSLFYSRFAAELAREEAAKAHAAELAQQAEDREKAEKEKLAQEEQRKREEERQRQEEAAEAKHLADWQKKMDDLHAGITAAKTQSAELKKEVADLTGKLKEERAALESDRRAQYDDALDLAQKKVTRERAELEVQRLTQVFSHRIEQSTLLAPVDSVAMTDKK